MEFAAWVSRAGWCLAGATVLSALSVVPIIAEHTRWEWLGWLGAPGAFVSFLVLKWSPAGGFLFPLFAGLIVNVAVLAMALFGTLVLVYRYRERKVTRV